MTGEISHQGDRNQAEVNKRVPQVVARILALPPVADAQITALSVQCRQTLEIMATFCSPKPPVVKAEVVGESDSSEREMSKLGSKTLSANKDYPSEKKEAVEIGTLINVFI